MSAQVQRRASREELQEMMNEGMSDRQIAVSLGMKLEALQKLRQRRGLLRGDTAPNRLPKTPEELAAVESLLDEGMSFRAASQITGITEKTIINHFPGRGFTREQTLEAQMMGRELSKIAA